MKYVFKKFDFTPSLLKAMAEEQLRGMKFQEKEGEKDKKNIRKRFRNSP